MGRRWIPGGTEMKIRILFVVMVLFASPVPVAVPGPVSERTLLVHVTTILDSDNDRTVLVPRMIAAALQKGHRVVLLFDAEGVLSLKMGRWFGGHSTPLDRVDITEKEKLSLAASLGTAPEDIPDIYGSLLHFFKGRGVAMYVNKQALRSRGIDNEHFDHAAEAVDEDRIIELLAGADRYVAY
jgi:hypothetical protein